MPVEFLHQMGFWSGSFRCKFLLLSNLFSCVYSIAQKAATSLWLENSLPSHWTGRQGWIGPQHALAWRFECLVSLHWALVGECDDVTIVEYVSIFVVCLSLIVLFLFGVDVRDTLLNTFPNARISLIAAVIFEGGACMSFPR